MSTQRGTLWAAILGSGVVFLDSNVVTVALPRIGHDLPAHWIGVLEGQAYVYNGYLLAESALLILAGGLTDAYGRRRVYTAGIVGFGVASIFSGLAPTLEWLVVCRVLQGVAGALVVPGSLALITAAFPGEEQGRAFGVWSGASAGLAILGPVVGGLLVDAVSWRAVFLINAPFILLALWLTRRYVHESRAASPGRGFDVIGTLLTAVAVGSLVVGTIAGQQREWRSTAAFVALGIGSVATALLPWWMRRARNPLVPPSLFRSRNFAVTNLSTFVIYAALAVTFYVLTLFLQGTLGYTAAAAGVATIPGVLFMALFSARFGALATRYGARWFLTAGPVLMALGVVWMTSLPATSAAWGLRLSATGTYAPPAGYVTHLLPGLLVFGVGVALMVAPLTATLMASVPAERAGIASALNTAVSDVGPQLAIAAVFVVMTAYFYSTVSVHVPGLDVTSPVLRRAVAPFTALSPDLPDAVQRAAREASTGAYRLAMLVSAALLLAGAVINGTGIRREAGGQSKKVISPDPSWRRCSHLQLTSP